MAQNPLQQYFRQPKIFVGLPSQGVYCKTGTIQGDVNRMPIYGMTGMDEILLKTPDALLSGESTATVIKSCCPAITDAWDLPVNDIELMLTAIRIATFGNGLSITNTCKKCATDNEYTIDLSRLIDHYGSVTYDAKLVLKELTITTRPLSYKQSSDFQLENFNMQQKLKQLNTIEDEAERKTLVEQVFKDLGFLRNQVYTNQIESVDTGSIVVTEKAFIREWVDNADRDIMAAISKHIEGNRDKWTPPEHHVTCQNCGHEEDLTLDLDQSNFFVAA
jgi:hypothetical protein